VLPATIVPMNDEQYARALEALTGLYVDFLDQGGLDVLRDRRSHAPPAKNDRERTAA
jgi:hypothetical protein